jgi:hypothetical protein
MIKLPSYFKYISAIELIVLHAIPILGNPEKSLKKFLNFLKNSPILLVLII